VAEFVEYEELFEDKWSHRYLYYTVPVQVRSSGSLTVIWEAQHLDEMERNAYTVLMGKVEGKRILRRPE